MQMREIRRAALGRRALSSAVLAMAIAFGGAVLAQEPAKTDANPTSGSKDVDRVVSHAPDRVIGAAKQALTTYGCEMKKERADYLECTRSRHLGVFVGSGGEKITVQLSPKEGGTRVVIKTGKGFAGRLGKKNWSTPVFAEMERLLQPS
jgi:hypothetical protein